MDRTTLTRDQAQTVSQVIRRAHTLPGVSVRVRRGPVEQGWRGCLAVGGGFDMH
jgi:hypothetical protein